MCSVSNQLHLVYLYTFNSGITLINSAITDNEKLMSSMSREITLDVFLMEMPLISGCIHLRHLNTDRPTGTPFFRFVQRLHPSSSRENSIYVISKHNSSQPHNRWQTDKLIKEKFPNQGFYRFSREYSL